MKPCKHCLRTKEDHCEYEALEMPAGCVCDPGTWGDSVPAPCAKYVGEGATYCATCEHDQACHRDGEAQ